MSLTSAETVLKTLNPRDKPKQRAPEMRSERFLEQSFIIKKGNPSVHALNLHNRYNETEGLNLCVFGQNVEPAKNKVILLLGATGSGKTTLINAMTNYILGVKWEDRYRFKLINEVTNKSQAESQTSKVTSYELYNQPGFQIPYSLTIVDTPGFGHTHGIEQDKMITKQIKSFLCNPLGIKHIDAVCFVIQASLAHLTPSQKYIFDSILSIFGKDMAENIMVMVTFADGSAIPALEAIKAANMPCKKNKKGQPTHFSFNNLALCAQATVPCDSGSDSDESDDGDNRNEMVWNSNAKKMKAFFKALENIEGKDLTLTVEVLEARERLSQAMESLTPQIQAGLSKMAEIESTKQLLRIEKEKIKDNENFEQEVDVVKTLRIPVNCITMNCNNCFFTCHSNCFLPHEDDTKTCAVFDDEGRCVKCPGGCPYSFHEWEKFEWKYETVKETKTVQELMDNFNKALNTFMSKHEIQEKLDEELNIIRCRLSDLVQISLKCLQRLDQIALKPRSLSASEYFDVLIKMEKEERKPGFEDRVVQLHTMKAECENLEKISDGKVPNLFKCLKHWHYITW
uniref:AIG1-type G domain-containing protein n=1 Tax=Astyanax mexicanus TaxID=7994 RepID=A0A3B1KM51_ASTMX